MFKAIATSLLMAVTLSLCHGVLANDLPDGPPSKRPLFFYLVIHDDLPQAKIDSLVENHFAWLIKDLESFTGRRINLEFIRNAPALTDFSYKGDDTDQLSALWKKQVDQYMNTHNLPRNHTTKYLLLTNNSINSKVMGFAIDKGYAGIASLETYPAPAHELGHMLGGHHDSAEVLYQNGWWCETNLMPTRVNLRANCYVFSDENKQRIAAHLSEYP
ncbi:hypothetical protein KDX38_17580 [Pseudomonas sp. CDFA 602]|uniref:hypothetical protein n=1 Tax=Pseudomonas californiensis TaxID=2829823 RepID=UPI001E35B0BE|nr:hypothetical protein [Pseudomonas californiensis]MCD5995386.1 hypothetical protein [Pseudomonas californiensis]MCD6001018.1 hypothetical protein [Pseudomonas californiensis]